VTQVRVLAHQVPVHVRSCRNLIPPCNGHRRTSIGSAVESSSLYRIDIVCGDNLSPSMFYLRLRAIHAVSLYGRTTSSVFEPNIVYSDRAVCAACV